MKRYTHRIGYIRIRATTHECAADAVDVFTDSDRLPGEASGTQNIQNLSAATSANGRTEPPAAGFGEDAMPAANPTGNSQQTPISLTGTITPCTYLWEGSANATAASHTPTDLKSSGGGPLPGAGTWVAIGAPAVAHSLTANAEQQKAAQQSPFDGVAFQAGMKALSLGAADALEDEEEFGDAVSQPGACSWPVEYAPF